MEGSSLVIYYILANELAYNKRIPKKEVGGINFFPALLTSERTFTYLYVMDVKKYFSKIANFHQENKRMPSYSETMIITGLRSKNAVYKLVNKMVSLGLVEKDKTGKIIPGKLFGQIPLLGTIEAGFPSPAEEELADTVTLDEYLIKNKEATYILKVTGDSMIEAGILPGDMVIVERGPQPKDGDIVIAEIDRGWTMKYFKKEGDRILLVAANKKYQPIAPKEELKISAVIKAVIRKY